jgi:hypothetical protein
MLSASSFTVDFESLASCSHTFSRLLWSSQSSNSLISLIQSVSVSPPAQFLSAGILPHLVRLSHFCEHAQSAISLALAAELVVLASSNSLETAHHRTFLFGSACALQLGVPLRVSENVIKGTMSPGMFRKRRLQESMAVISEVLIALNLAPLRFTAKVGIKDASQEDSIVRAILSIKTESASHNSLLPLEVYAETFTSFRQQVQSVLSGDSLPSPLVLDYCDTPDPLDLEETNSYLEVCPGAQIESPTAVQSEALAIPQLPHPGDHTPHAFASDFRAISASIMRLIVTQVLSRFGSSPSHDLNSERRVFEPVCAQFLKTVVLEASKKYLKRIMPSVPISSLEDGECVACHSMTSVDVSPDKGDGASQSSPIFGRHPSYRAPVQHVEVISFEQVNPVWVHQCKPGSRICVLLRCHQRFSIDASRGNN